MNPMGGAGSPMHVARLVPSGMSEGRGLEVVNSFVDSPPSAETLPSFHPVPEDTDPRLVE